MNTSLIKPDPADGVPIFTVQSSVAERSSCRSPVLKVLNESPVVPIESMEHYERERQRVRTRLLSLSARTDPNLGKHEELVVRELFRLENEETRMSNEKQDLCKRLAAYAWHVVHSRDPQMSSIRIADALHRVYQSADAVEFYGNLLCQNVNRLCVEQVAYINERIKHSPNLSLLDESWQKHKECVRFFVDHFVPNDIRGEWLREKLHASATDAYRQIVLAGSALHTEVLDRFKQGRMSVEEKIAAIRILNAVDDHFFELHTASTLTKCTQLMDQARYDRLTPAEIVFEAMDWLQEEQKMFELIGADAKQMLLFTTRVRKHVVSTLLAAHMRKNSNFHRLIDNHEFDALTQLCRLFQSIEGGCEELLELVADFIRHKKPARPTVSSSKNSCRGSPKSPNRQPLSFVVVNDFLAFKALLLDSLLRNCFNDDKRFRERIERELQTLVMAEEHFPQYLAFYIDYQMKRHQQEDIGRAADLLRYVPNKESFEQFYRGYLAGRLINGTPADLMTEKALVDRFKLENGPSYTRKMEKMIADVSISRELLGEFVNSLEDGQQQPPISVNVADEPPPTVHGVQFTATILSESFWPAHYRPIVCRLPPTIENLYASFEQFYLSRHSGRKLRLNLAIGSAVVSARFFGADAMQETLVKIAKNDPSPLKLSKMRSVAKKSFVITSLQMAFFDLFNDRVFVTMQELLSLELPMKILQRTVMPILNMRIISRQGNEIPDFSPTSNDIYFVNDEFRSKKPTINLRKNLAYESPKVKRMSGNHAEFNRYVTEAAIVRIMKQERTLTHDALVERVTEAVVKTCHPTEALWKKCLDNLLASKYIRRKTNDGDDKEIVYEYLDA